LATLPTISDAEWQVMQVIWDRSPITAAHVIEALEPTTRWSPRTIKTMLARLVRKGALTYSEEGNRYLYRPRVTEQACIKAASRSFLDRVFGGDPSLMLAHLVKTGRLSSKDIDALRRILDQKEQ
jgi:BlaI family penicillinase repressor